MIQNSTRNNQKSSFGNRSKRKSLGTAGGWEIYFLLPNTSFFGYPVFLNPLRLYQKTFKIQKSTKTNIQTQKKHLYQKSISNIQAILSLGLQLSEGDVQLGRPPQCRARLATCGGHAKEQRGVEGRGGRKWGVACEA